MSCLAEYNFQVLLTPCDPGGAPYLHLFQRKDSLELDTFVSALLVKVQGTAPTATICLGSGQLAVDGSSSKTLAFGAKEGAQSTEQ